MMRDSTFRFIRRRQGTGAAMTYRLLMALAALVRIAALIPLLVLSGTSLKARIRSAMKKWAVILRWSAGMEPGLTPTRS